MKVYKSTYKNSFLDHHGEGVVFIPKTKNDLEKALKEIEKQKFDMVLKSGYNKNVSKVDVHEKVILELSEFKSISEPNKDSFTVGCGVTQLQLFNHFHKKDSSYFLPLSEFGNKSVASVYETLENSSTFPLNLILKGRIEILEKFDIDVNGKKFPNPAINLSFTVTPFKTKDDLKDLTFVFGYSIFNDKVVDLKKIIEEMKNLDKGVDASLEISNLRYIPYIKIALVGKKDDSETIEKSVQKMGFKKFQDLKNTESTPFYYVPSLNDHLITGMKSFLQINEQEIYDDHAITISECKETSAMFKDEFIKFFVESTSSVTSHHFYAKLKRLTNDTWKFDAYSQPFVKEVPNKFTNLRSFITKKEFNEEKFKEISFTKSGNVTLDGFKGEIYNQQDPDYDKHRDQYAFSSFDKEIQDKRIKPFFIAYPMDEKDVEIMINYAIDKKKKVVARSGGHQYCGLSSGGEDTILLSMDHLNDIKQEGEKVALGPGAVLKDIAEKMNEFGVSVPHGECPLVAIGGHCQTGGYGHFLRSFGLCLDYIDSFKIVLADGKTHQIKNPFYDAVESINSLKPGTTFDISIDGKTIKKDIQIPKDKEGYIDLFTSTFGKKFDTFSKSFKIHYEKDKVIDVNLENADLFSSVLGGGPGSFGILTQIVLKPNKNIDYPDSAGYQGIYLYSKDLFHKIQKEVQNFTDLQKKGQLPEGFDFMSTVLTAPFNDYVPVDLPPLLSWFKPFESVIFVEYVALNEKAQQFMEESKKRIFDTFHISYTFFEGKQKISFMANSFVRRTLDLWKKGREFLYPYIKRYNCTKKPLTDEFVEKFVDLVDETQKKKGVYLVFQMNLGGGQYQRNTYENMWINSISHRDCTHGVVYDLFYDEYGKEDAKNLQIKFKNEMIGEGKCYSDKDYRMQWASFEDEDEKKKVNEDDLTMSKPETQSYYFEDKELFEKLREVKSKYDKEDLFHTIFTIPLKNSNPSPIDDIPIKK